jgi:hypothetical protein
MLYNFLNMGLLFLSLRLISYTVLETVKYGQVSCCTRHQDWLC